MKDSMGAPDQKMADVGAGTIDFKTIFARAEDVEHYFVEHDQPADRDRVGGCELQVSLHI